MSVLVPNIGAVLKPATRVEVDFLRSAAGMNLPLRNMRMPQYDYMIILIEQVSGIRKEERTDSRLVLRMWISMGMRGYQLSYTVDH